MRTQIHELMNGERVSHFVREEGLPSSSTINMMDTFFIQILRECTINYEKNTSYQYKLNVYTCLARLMAYVFKRPSPIEVHPLYKFTYEEKKYISNN